MEHNPRFDIQQRPGGGGGEEAANEQDDLLGSDPGVLPGRRRAPDRTEELQLMD